MFFKGKNIVQEIKYWLMEFKKTVDKEVGNQHLQFTAEIWTNDENSLPSANMDKVQILTSNEFPFLDMKISRSPEGYLQFRLLKKKRQQLKYVGMGITHTPVTLRAIPSGFLNRLVKLTFAKTLFSF